jgi:hypothetical protein
MQAFMERGSRQIVRHSFECCGPSPCFTTPKAFRSRRPSACSKPAGLKPSSQRRAINPVGARSLPAFLGEGRTGLTITLTARAHLRLQAFHAVVGLGIPPRRALLLLRLNTRFRAREDLLLGGWLWLTCQRHPSAHKHECCPSLPSAHPCHGSLLSTVNVGLNVRMMHPLSVNL